MLSLFKNKIVRSNSQKNQMSWRASYYRDRSVLKRKAVQAFRTASILSDSNIAVYNDTKFDFQLIIIFTIIF